LEGTQFDQNSIVYAVADEAPDEMPSNVRTAKIEFQRLESRIRRIFKGQENKIRSYIDNITLSARVVFENGYIGQSNEIIEQIKDSITENEGVNLRTSYISEVFRIALPIFIISGIVAFFSYGISSHLKENYLSDEQAFFAHIITPACWIVFGICAGWLLAIMTQNRTLKFERLGYFDGHSYPPIFRLSYLILLSLILSILLVSEILIIGVTDDFLLNNFSENEVIAIIFGILIGFSEPQMTNFAIGALEQVGNRTTGEAQA